MFYSLDVYMFYSLDVYMFYSLVFYVTCYNLIKNKKGLNLF
jgi:hypothetical protein